MNIQNWTLYLEGVEPLQCQAPCTMYSVLLENKKIPDPFYGLNERELQHLGEKDCTFVSLFPVDEKILSRERVELVFHGLNTLCRIYLNGKLLDQVKNMHRTYIYEVKDRLRQGENCLRLEFQSPVQFWAEEERRHHLFMNADTIPGVSHLRTAYYQAGWDWGPTLPDMGIFREVELQAFDIGRLDGILVSQKHHDGVVDVTVRAKALCSRAHEIYVSLDGSRVRMEDGETVIRVENPNLWWIRGYGDQPLYELKTELTVDGKTVDTDFRRIGLRTLTVSTQPDPDGSGSEFCFVINGVKIFAMGANYIPMDNLMTRVNRQRQETLIRQAVDANFNTLRVWGGGYYPEDDFYDLCDEYGILVWQDFMVACANIWLTEDMAEEFTREAEDNLLRLQHHAALGLLCGNNEMEDMILGGAQNTELVRHDYLHLYELLLPQLCRKYAPDTFYWPSSPSSGGGFDDPGSLARGDTHYWTVWHGGVPFTDYRRHSFRFCSEYGFESFPSMKTIRTFCEEQDQNCFSRVMENHQKCKGGNGKILRYLSDHYLYPGTFENLVYASQLLQADAIKYGVEHFRRQRGYCMGSIYWQFNDCWPVASWSSVDSFGRYKALHYAARKFYAPVAMGLFLEEGRLTVNIANETRSAFHGSIRMALCRRDMTVLEEDIRTVTVKALASCDVCTCCVNSGDPFHTYLYVDLYDENGAFLMRQVELLVPAKHFEWLRPEIKVDFADTEEGVELLVSSDVFTKGVCLDFRDFDCVLSDNFFSLTDPKPYRVLARTDRSAEELKANLILKTVYDIR